MPSALCLSETRFSSSHTENISGYDSYHTTRNSETPAGGISMFIRQNFVSNMVCELSYCNQTIEVCTVNVRVAKLNILLIGIYRPHSDTIINFTSHLSNFLQNSLLKNKMCILMGDFNICLLKNDECNQNFINTLYGNHFIPLITKFTRFSPVAGEMPSLLDHFWINKFNSCTTGILNVDITDHLPTFIHLNLENKDVGEKQKITFRETNQIGKRNFKNALCSFDWQSLFSENVDLYMDRFVNTLNSIYCDSFPLKTKYVSPNHSCNPWFTAELKQLVDAKSNYFQLHRLDLRIVSVSENNHYRNKVNKIVRDHKKIFYQELFARQRGDMRKTWKTINSILSRNSNRKDIEKIIVNNITYTDNDDIASVFNSYFCSVGSEIDSNIPQSSLDPLHYVNTNVTSSFFLHPVSSNEVSHHIKNLKNSKQNINSISVHILKENCDHFISDVLADIINICFEKGMFPESMKVALVLPLHKKGDRKTLSNFRPISLLPIFSKVMEKCLKSRLQQYFTEKNVFNPVQFGYQTGISTQDAIILVMEKIYANLNNKKSSLSIFVDFSKCFDSLNIGILVRKLDSYGIRGVPLALIISYLTGRKQAVIVNGVTSDFMNINIGVPQGSVLGPLLFLIYVNEIPFISDLFSTCLFADDTTLIFESSSSFDLVNMCNSGLDLFHEWCCSNRLSINVSKTNAMLISNIHALTDVSNVFLNGNQINYTSSVRFLGLDIDDKLKFNFHINNIASKISRNAGILYKLRQYVPTDTLIFIYRSFVESYLNYCPIVFGNAFQSHLRPLEVAQRRCIRIIANEHPQAHSDPLFLQLKLLKFRDIYKFNLGTYMYNNIEKFSSNLQSNEYSTRSGNNYYLPTFQRLSLTLNQSILYQAPSNWNNIPQFVKNTPSINSFKKHYKDFLLSEY